MQRYVIAENIRRFHDLLGEERSQAKRELLEALLREEEAKLAALDDPPPEAASSKG
jgi:hypothetical protein